MKHLLFLCPLLLSGCAMLGMPKMDKVINAFAKDPASVHVKIPTPYGVVEIIRANPGPNTLTHSLTPEGKIEVKK